MRFAFLALLAFSAVASQDAKLNAPLARPQTQDEKSRGVMQSERAREGENIYRYAVELRADGFRERALEILREFPVRFPGHDRIFHARFEESAILIDLGELRESAEIDATTCQEFARQPRAADACIRAARTYRKTGETEKAERIFNDVIRDFPGSSASRLASAELSNAKLANSLVVNSEQSTSSTDTPESHSTEPATTEHAIPGQREPGPANSERPGNKEENRDKDTDKDSRAREPDSNSMLPGEGVFEDIMR